MSTPVRIARPGCSEPWRHHTDDRVPVAVDAQLAPDRIGAPAETALPQASLMTTTSAIPGVVVFGPNTRPSCGRTPSREKYDGLTSSTSTRSGSSTSREVRVDRIDTGDVVEEAGAIAIVEQLRRRHADVGAAEPRQIGRHAHEAIGIGERQRPEDDGVHDREDRRCWRRSRGRA